MGLFKDLANQQINSWYVLYRVDGPVTQWYCRCNCGSERVVRAGHLSSGKSTSCGCAERPAKHGHARNGKMTKKYKTWRSIRARCLNPDHQDAHIYHGLLCQAWLEYENFDRDVPDPPDENLTIDRIDNDKGYEPGNVRWASWTEQHRNQTNNCWIEFDGRRLLLADWARELGVNPSGLKRKIDRYGVAVALVSPTGTRIAPAHNRQLLSDGEHSDTAKGWMTKLNLTYDQIRTLKKNGDLKIVTIDSSENRSKDHSGFS